MKKNKRLSRLGLLSFMAMMCGMFFMSTSSAAMNRYTVQKGDTLWLISLRYHVKWQDIWQANKSQIPNPHLIYPGQVLTIPSANIQVSAYEQQVVDLCNAERSKNGLPPLTLNADLAHMAHVKAQDMRDKNYFDHNSPTYGSPFQMMKTFGISYSYAGENIAAGQPDPQSVVNSWMNSPGHRANILNRNYTQIGVGFVSGGSYRTYWAEEFIRP